MKKITLLDGAVGTSLWAKAEKYGYAKNPVWTYNIDHPEMVSELAHDFINAGSEIILTNTFGANGPAVERFPKYNADTVIKTAVRLARDAVSGTDVKIALAAGPLSMLMEPYGDLTEEEVKEIYEKHFNAGMEIGADAICIQTFMDIEMMRCAAEVAVGYGVPVYCTMTFEKRGKTMMGNSVDDVIEALSPLGIAAIGMNCSLGPDLAIPVIREFSEKTDIPLMFKPNAGKPILSTSGEEIASYDQFMFAHDVAPALEFVDYIGGCCGCGPDYISELAKALGR